MSESWFDFYKPSDFPRVPGASCGYLLHIVSQIPGVTIKRRCRWFWPIFNRVAEFEFNGRQFEIDPDVFDGVYWITPKDGVHNSSEMQALQKAVDDYMRPSKRVLEFFRRLNPWR